MATVLGTGIFSGLGTAFAIVGMAPNARAQLTARSRTRTRVEIPPAAETLDVHGEPNGEPARAAVMRNGD